MKIVNAALLRDLEAGRGLQLNLGAGPKPLPGFYNLDLLELPGVDVVADLNEPLAAFPDNSVAAIRTRHTFEHVANFLPLMRELHRVTRPGGSIEIVVPHFSNPYGYSDPTHVRFFGLYSFHYFADAADQPGRKVPSFYVSERFRIVKLHIRLLTTAGESRSLVDRVLAKFLEPLINASIGMQDFYERKLCRLVPASELKVLLQPVKAARAAQAA